MDPLDQLKQGCDALDLPVDDAILQQCLQYLALMVRWNRITNLTAITDLSDMVDKHLLDSMAVHPYLTGHRLLDVGSGAGLPGIPLALLNPDRQFVLLDANGKKTRFMTQASIDLGLSNVIVVQSRVEDLDDTFDAIISRAFTSLSGMVSACCHLLAPGGSFLAMKGPDVIEELKMLQTPAVDAVGGADPAGWEAQLQPLQVPAVLGERYLAVIRRSGDRVSGTGAAA